jgi:hypothetical protein
MGSRKTIYRIISKGHAYFGQFVLKEVTKYESIPPAPLKEYYVCELLDEYGNRTGRMVDVLPNYLEEWK